MRQLKIFLYLSIFAIACSSNRSSNTILVLGDSNGAHEQGWVYHLDQIIETDSILNFSISGNTIGFDNLGRSKLNTLKNIDRILQVSDSAFSNIKTVLILLGTNDCKAVFKDSLDKTVQNLEQLIKKINQFEYQNNKTPEIVIITPSPYGSKSEMTEKYIGGDARVQKLIPEFKKTAEKNQTGYIDIYTPLKPNFETLTEDGVHLTQDGYKQVAAIIQDYLVSQNNYQVK
jgi:lysophospholipase L1-like esterase